MRSAAMLLAAALAVSVQAKDCEKEWPDDYQMQMHCKLRQGEGAKTLFAFVQANGLGDPDAPGFAEQLAQRAVNGDTAAGIVVKCMQDWPDDFQMVAHCLDRQAQAARVLGHDVKSSR